MKHIDVLDKHSRKINAVNCVSKKSKIKGIVLKSNANIILDKKRCIDFANKNKMFISVKWKK